MKGILKAAGEYHGLNDPKAISHLNESLSQNAMKLYKKKLKHLDNDEFQNAYHHSLPGVLKKVKPGTYSIISQ